jgi:hypothetical protein
MLEIIIHAKRNGLNRWMWEAAVLPDHQANRDTTLRWWQCYQAHRGEVARRPMIVSSFRSITVATALRA